jgi:Rieske Fe-S protein
MSLTRKNFINSLLSLGGLGSIVAAGFPIISFLFPPKTGEVKVNSIKAGKAEDFPLNSSKILKFGRKPIILVRTEDEKFHAVSAVCTHLECIVQYKKETSQIWCACHNGMYDLKGRNVSGPPPRPLKEFVVSIVKDEIVITQAG